MHGCNYFVFPEVTNKVNFGSVLLFSIAAYQTLRVTGWLLYIPSHKWYKLLHLFVIMGMNWDSLCCVSWKDTSIWADLGNVSGYSPQHKTLSGVMYCTWACYVRPSLLALAAPRGWPPFCISSAWRCDRRREAPTVLKLAFIKTEKQNPPLVFVSPERGQSKRPVVTAGAFSATQFGACITPMLWRLTL